MRAFPRQEHGSASGRHSALDRRRTLRATSIRVATSLAALAVLFLAVPTAASAAPAADVAASTTGASPIFLGLDLAAVLWLLVGVVGLVAGLFAGSRNVADRRAIAQPAGAQSSLTFPAPGQSSFGTRQAAGINDHLNEA